MINRRKTVNQIQDVTGWVFVGSESCKSENFNGKSIAPSFGAGKGEQLGL